MKYEKPQLMNPLELLAYKGIVITQYYSQKQIGNSWKITYRSTQRLGQDTINMFTAYLRPFIVERVTIKNAKIPSIIICEMDHIIAESKKRKHSITLYVR